MGVYECFGFFVRMLYESVAKVADMARMARTTSGNLSRLRDLNSRPTVYETVLQRSETCEIYGERRQGIRTKHSYTLPLLIVLAACGGSLDIPDGARLDASPDIQEATTDALRPFGGTCRFVRFVGDAGAVEGTDVVVRCVNGNEFTCGDTTQKLPCGDPRAHCPPHASYCVTPDGGFGIVE